MPSNAENEYRYAAELAQDANHAAEDGREVHAKYTYQRTRLIEWDRTIAPQRATMLAFVILFPVIAVVEYLFSEELYRDLLPRSPWAMGLIFAVLAVIIAELLVYRFFEVKRQWKANELKRSEQWRDQVDKIINRHIKAITRKQFWIGMVLMLVMSFILSYMSWDRVHRMINAGERINAFGPVDVLPVILYLFEIITGMFIWYVILRIALGYQVRKLKKRFDKSVRQCSELTIDAVGAFNRAEKQGYDFFQEPVTKSIQEAFCRNDAIGEANGVDYISEQINAVFSVKLHLFYRGTARPFVGNVKVITDYKFTEAAGTQDGQLHLRIASFQRLRPEEGNRTEDSIRTILVETEENGKFSERTVKVAIDLDDEGPHTVYL